MNALADLMIFWADEASHRARVLVIHLDDPLDCRHPRIADYALDQARIAMGRRDDACRAARNPAPMIMFNTPSALDMPEDSPRNSDNDLREESGR
jgi:hypothetical protein